MQERSRNLTALSILMIVYLIGSYAYAHVGMINLDEGWYLCASDQAWHGKVPYRDFAYTQPPLMPYIYGISQLVSEYRLYAGRFESLVFGGLAILFSMLSALRLRGRLAAVVCGICLVFSPFTLYYFTITKTYSLTSCLLALAIFILVTNGDKWWNYSLAAFVLSVAAGVRLSFIAPLIGFLVCVAFFEWGRARSLCCAIIVSMSTLGAIYLPFWYADPDNLWFNLVTFHMSSFQHLSLFNMFYDKLDRLGTLMSNIWLPALLTLAGMMMFVLWLREPLRVELAKCKHYAIMATLLVTVTLAHLIPRAMQAEYHVVILPVLGIFAGCVISKWHDRAIDVKFKRLQLAVFAGAVAISVLGGNHFLDARGTNGPLDRIHQLADEINRLDDSNQEVFTFQTYIAVEAGRSVVPGLEMSVFSYYPEWGDSLCQRRRVMNADMMVSTLENLRPATVVLTDRDFLLESVLMPQAADRKKEAATRLRKVLQLRYDLIRTYEDIGHYHDRAHIYRAKVGAPL